MTAKPLAGLRVVVTRARAQASVLNERLAALGAIPVEISMIEIVPPLDGGDALRSALRSADPYDLIAVASPNGARALAAAAGEIEATGAELPTVACVGPSTAARLRETDFTVSVVPGRAVAEGLVEAVGSPARAGGRVLLVQAEVARDVLERGLAENGWVVDRVTAYRTVDAAVEPGDRDRAAESDIVTFTSSSTVDRYLRLLGRDALPPAVATIGPITSATARDHGVRVDVEADPHTIDGLVEAVVGWARDHEQTAADEQAPNSNPGVGPTLGA